jgi:hypothetical protein
MECLKRVSVIRMSRRLSAFLLLIAAISNSTPAQTTHVSNDLGRLRVLNVRLMSAEEYKRRVVDYIGATYTVRLRFEAPADRGVYVYAPNIVEPIGYSLERTGSAIRWLVGTEGLDDSRSPGFPHLEKAFGKGWLFLPAQAALEWEAEIEPIANGKEDAKSVFVREGLTASPRELISDWYSTQAR